MEFGNISVSLAVKDISASQEFYEKLGFKVVDGGHANKDYPDKEGERWRVMQKETVNIGLFEGMFEHNIMTFNPLDVRAIQKKLKKEGIMLTQETDPDGSGAGFITLEDPDGNHIMFDQW